MSNSLVEFLIKLLLIESNKDRYKLAQKLLSSEMKNMLALNMQSIRHFAFSFGILRAVLFIIHWGITGIAVYSVKEECQM